MKSRIGAIVLAGGKGSRMESDIQKQYMMLNGRPLITYALDAFEASLADDIVLVTGEEDVEYVRTEIVTVFGYSKVSAVVAGGRERYHSVYEGLRAMENCDYVLIHDGARPLITTEIISRAAEGAMSYQSCVVAMPVKDTIKIADSEEYGIETPDRNRLWQIQTPQAFSYDVIREAYDWLMGNENYQQGITDDAMVVEKYTGNPVKLIKGSYMNLKVTTPEDLLIAAVFLNAEKKV